jgi:hypothetical protein
VRARLRPAARGQHSKRTHQERARGPTAHAREARGTHTHEDRTHRRGHTPPIPTERTATQIASLVRAVECRVVARRAIHTHSVSRTPLPLIHARMQMYTPSRAPSVRTRLASPQCCDSHEACAAPHTTEILSSQRPRSCVPRASYAGEPGAKRHVCLTPTASHHRVPRSGLHGMPYKECTCAHHHMHTLSHTRPRSTAREKPRSSLPSLRLRRGLPHQSSKSAGRCGRGRLTCVAVLLR